MKVVHKYEAEIRDTVTVDMPVHAQILSVGQQENPRTICIWALVNQVGVLTKRTFHIMGTGHLREAQEVQNFIGTVHTIQGLVWHVFERGVDNPFIPMPHRGETITHSTPCVGVA